MKKRKLTEIDSVTIASIIKHLLLKKWLLKEVAVKFNIKPVLVGRLLSRFMADPDYIE